MKLRDFPLLTDENISPVVVEFLRQEGFDVLDATENGWQGMLDSEHLNRALADGRVVVTHDGDFGSLAILNGQPLIGIFFVRPGHHDPAITIDTIKIVLANDPDLQIPFLLVAKRGTNQVNIRVRLIAP
ncbi:MAG: DUF5615 family PIN-like protein [Gemmatales bacterium]